MMSGHQTDDPASPVGLWTLTGRAAVPRPGARALVPAPALSPHPSPPCTGVQCQVAAPPSPISATCAPRRPGVARPRSEQLCPLHPQAAQPLGALVPRAVLHAAGPTGQVLALDLGQVTACCLPGPLESLHLSPQAWRLVCVPHRPQGRWGGPQRVGGRHQPTPALPPAPMRGEVRPPAPSSPQGSPQAPSSSEPPEGAPGGSRRGCFLCPVGSAGHLPTPPPPHTHPAAPSLLPAPHPQAGQVRSGCRPPALSEVRRPPQPPWKGALMGGMALARPPPPPCAFRSLFPGARAPSPSQEDAERLRPRLCPPPSAQQPGGPPSTGGLPLASSLGGSNGPGGKEGGRGPQWQPCSPRVGACTPVW